MIFSKVNGISLEYVTHEEAVTTIADIAEKYNQITLKVGKVTQIVDQEEFLRFEFSEFE